MRGSVLITTNQKKSSGLAILIGNRYWQLENWGTAASSEVHWAGPDFQIFRIGREFMKTYEQKTPNSLSKENF